MQTTAEILDRFSHLLPYVFSLGLAILFFFAFFLLRKPMVRLLFKIFHRCLRRFHSAQEIIDGFEKPLCAFLVCIGVYLGVWELTRGFSALLGLLPLLRTFLRISLIVALTWGLMNAAEPIVAAVKGSHAGLDKALITFVARIVRGLLFVLSVILIISETGYDITGQSEEQLREACRRLGVEVDETMGKGKLIDAIFGQYCEEELIQPTFVCDYPIEMSPLCKRHRDNPDLTERFELFVNGKELCNAYSELNDPIDQLERFQEQLRLLEKGDDEAMFIDMDFVRALEYGMPSCSGMGIGIDRLTMFLTGQSSIQDVLFFPQMRPEKKVQRDPDEAYAAIGVPAEWIPVIQKMGYLTVDALRKLPAGKFFNDLCGFNKKNKLGLKAPSIEEVKAWCAPAAE